MPSALPDDGPGDRIRARYLLETALSPERAAAVIAGEQSSGTFVPVPGESEELKARSAARVERITLIENRPEPSLPGASAGDGLYSRVEMVISWPLANCGPSLPNLMATVAGNLFELAEVSGLKLLDLDLPAAFADAYPGPAFGVAGTRQLTGVVERPLIGTIIKPSVGLGPGETADLVRQLCEGDIDFIKDDELQANGPHCPFEARYMAVQRVLDRHRERTGRTVMYAVNLTGEIDEMRARHDLVAEHGGTCVMASLNSVGLTGISALRRHARLPIHAHRNGWGYLGRSPVNGFSYIAWQKFWRLAGVDHMHVNGLANKFWEPDESVVDSARECLKPLFPNKPCTVLPIFSSGQSAKQMPGTYAALGRPDFMLCAGGGIVAHPGGIAAGVRALHQAWEAAKGGIPLDVAAREARELREALARYGS